MNYFKHLLITGGIAMITMLVLFGGANLYAEDEETEHTYHLFDYDDDFTVENNKDWSFKKLNDAYLAEMNEYFNQNFKQLEELLKKDKFDQIKAPAEKIIILLPSTNGTPAEKKDLEEGTVYYADACKGTKKDKYKNVSSYCVAIGATKAHLIFTNKMQLATKSVNDNLDPEFEKARELQNNGEYDIKDFWGTTTLDLQRTISNNKEFVDTAIQKSEASIKQSLEIYDEFKLAYPMHVKLKKIRNSLITYKLVMKKLTNQARYIPGKFIDVTSKDCE
jgi:hypothetical protein